MKNNHTLYIIQGGMVVNIVYAWELGYSEWLSKYYEQLGG